MTPDDLNKLSWFEFEMLFTSLKQQLEKEAEQRKRQQRQDASSQMSIKAQLDRYFAQHKLPKR